MCGDVFPADILHPSCPKKCKSSFLILSIFLLAIAAKAHDSPPAPIVPAEQTVTSYTLPPDTLSKATALYRVRLRLWMIDTLFGFVLLLGFLYGRIGVRIRELAERMTVHRSLQGFIFVPILLLALIAFQLPIEVYGQRLSLSYGLSVQTWGSWFGDWGKNLLLVLLIGTAAICGAYALMRKSPQRWWFWYWVISLPFLVFFVFLSPLVIDPMFDRFEPLEQRRAELVGEIEKVVNQGGLAISRDRMFEMQASDKVTNLNAYVTGIGASKRVVVWDNTANALTNSQTLYVFGHEMAHYVLDHIGITLGFLALLLLIGCYLGARLGKWAVSRYGPRWGLRDLLDWASLPLLFLITSLFVFVTDPIAKGFSRYLERQADRYGIEVIHGIVPDANQAAAQAFQALGQNGLSYPNPNRLLVFWTYDHPPISERIEFVLHYNPWAEGKKPEFVKPR
jgi:Zn-dependent protease with chaperone function